jgi:hypothetical protein
MIILYSSKFHAQEENEIEEGRCNSKSPLDENSSTHIQESDCKSILVSGNEGFHQGSP